MEINQDRAGHFIVQRLEPQGPAERSKISIGDRILRVNGTQIDGLHINEVVSLCVEILEQK
jgi:C-terminal processing protease CtpA/Prc